MGSRTKSITDELFDVVKSWMPRKTKAPNVSRDFWMPDHSCRVCYECDSQFSTFNRRHHCRLCGRVFCAKCTSKSIPAPSDEPNTGQEDWERIRVCNFCYKQWEDETMAVSNGVEVTCPGLSPTQSSTSLFSSTSGTGKCSSTAASMAISTEAFQHVSNGSGSGLSPGGNGRMGSITDKQDLAVYGTSTDPLVDVDDQSDNIFGFCVNRSDDENDDYSFYQSDSETRDLSQTDGFYGSVNYEDIDHPYVTVKENSEEDIERRDLGSSPTRQILDSQELEGVNNPGKIPNDNIDGGEGEAPSSSSVVEGKMVEPVDFENNGLLWIPPGPEDVEDDKEAVLFDDDEDDATGEWRHLHPSTSFGDGESRTKEKSGEEHKKAMKNVVDGHFRALVAQLLQVENLPVGEEVDRESWLDIITSLSWEAATFLKPDTSKGGGMDPGGYVKVKCLACGRRSESMVLKGVVCKKNVAHKRMTSKIEKPRFLILGGALEYQRVSNSLSSIDTLLQQEMDHLKMAVAKIDAQHPTVLLVEKTVSRFAQEYLHAKDIALVLKNRALKILLFKLIF